MALPKLEGIFTVSGGSGSGGAWRCVLTETGGGGATGNVDVAAADYYLNTATNFCTALKNALDGIGNATYTVSIDDGSETSTGKTTISASGGSVTAFQIVWTDTAMRDTLGFTGTVSGALTYTSTNHCKYLWLPNCGRTGDVPEPVTSQAWFGRGTADTTVVRAPSGQTVAINYNTLHNARLQWLTVQGKKSWKGSEAVTNESFEQFWRDVLRYGKRFRYHPDRSVDTSTNYWTLVPLDPRTLPIQAMDPSHFSAGSIHEIAFDVGDYVA